MPKHDHPNRRINPIQSDVKVTTTKLVPCPKCDHKEPEWCQPQCITENRSFGRNEESGNDQGRNEIL